MLKRLIAVAAMIAALPSPRPSPRRAGAARTSSKRRRARSNSRPSSAWSKKPAWSGRSPARRQYTVFAPTNAAFAKVPKATLNMLLENKAMLKQVLLYHVLPGRVPASKVLKTKSANTAEGDQGPVQRPRQKRLRERIENHQNRHRMQQRDHPRDQRGPDPAGPRIGPSWINPSSFVAFWATEDYGSPWGWGSQAGRPEGTGPRKAGARGRERPSRPRPGRLPVREMRSIARISHTGRSPTLRTLATRTAAGARATARTETPGRADPPLDP